MPVPEEKMWSFGSQGCWQGLDLLGILEEACEGKCGSGQGIGHHRLTPEHSLDEMLREDFPNA